MCTNFPIIEQKAIIDFNGLSDHSSQMLQVRLSSFAENNPQFAYKRVFNEQNYNNLYAYLQNETWLSVYEAHDVNAAFRVFSELLIYYINIAFPITKICLNKNQKKPWMTEGIRTSSKNLKLLYKLVIDSQNNIIIKNYYNNYKKVYKRIIQSAKRMHNDTIYRNSTNKSKTVWNIIENTLANKNSVNISTMLINEENTTDKVVISNTFNTFFTEGPRKLLSTQSADGDHLNFPPNQINMFFSPVCECDIIKVMKTLKKSNSFGIDGISSNFLKSVTHFIVKPLTYLVNMSIESAIFPEILKTARVIPLYKKGDNMLLENYRPISLLSSISKILEKIVFEQVCNFLSAFRILTNCQHGFRKGKSTATAILQFLEQLYNYLDINNKCFGLFMDLSKAFDLIDHALLVSKLNHYGFRGKVSDWLQSYLKNRSQVVDI